MTNNIWSHPEINYIGIDSYFRFENNPYVIPTSESDPIQTYPDEDFIQLVADEWIERLDNQILPFAAGLGKPVVFTEHGYQHHNGSSRNPQNESGAVDTAEQIMAFHGLLRALDGRQDVLRGHAHLAVVDDRLRRQHLEHRSHAAGQSAADNCAARPVALRLRQQRRAALATSTTMAPSTQPTTRRGATRWGNSAPSSSPGRRQRQRHRRRRRLRRLEGRISAPRPAAAALAWRRARTVERL